MLNKLILLFVTFLLLSCKEDTNKNLSLISNEQNNVVKNKSDFYNVLDLTCTSDDAMVKSCTYKDSLKVQIDYNNEPNTINFEINKQNYSYNLNSIFEGIGSNIYLYQKGLNKILLVELSYEYSSKIFVFQIENNEIFFLKNVEFTIPEGKYSYKIREKQDGISIILSNNGNEIEKMVGNYSLRKVLNKKIEQHVKILWDGTYSYCIPNLRTDTIKSVTCHEITISNNKAVIESNTRFFCNGEYKVYKNEDEIELKYNDGDESCKNSSFKIKKTNNEYFVNNPEKSTKWFKLNKN